MKKILSAICVLSLFVLSLCSCDMTTSEQSTNEKFDASNKITVVSREEGAGLRGVFADLFDFMEDDKDLTFSGVSVKESADDIKAIISTDNYAIGYLPLVSVGDKVKTVKVNGVLPTRDNVKNGSYVFKHEINAVTVSDASDGAKDFVNFLISKKAREILTDEGYITSDKQNEFTSTKPEGTLKLYVSASAEPAISKLKDEYAKHNDKLKIEITKANAKSALESLKDKDSLAIITRELTDEEEKAYKETEICEDAVAVVVNKNNSLENISSDNIKKIYKGEITKWSDIIK